MTELTDGITKLEELVKAHRDDLSAKRTNATNPAPAASPTPTNEEQLWDSVQQKLLDDRMSKAPAQPDKKGSETFLEQHSLFISVGLALVAIIVFLAPITPDDAVPRFKNFAFAAALIGVVAAFCRVLAHGRSAALDALGKMLGLSSALLAAIAAGALLVLVKLA